MTAPARTGDVVLDWFHLLPEDVRRYVNATQALAGYVRAAINTGWTLEQLADEAARDHATSRRIASVVTDRMERAAASPPHRTHTPFATFQQPLAWCGQCSDRITRWALTDVDEPARRCHCYTRPPEATTA